MGQQQSTTLSIRRLSIKNFRSIKSMVWWPGPGLNLILGGGDVGKTTILDAISLLLSPTNSTFVPDTDYFERNEEAEFVIDAIVKLPGSGTVNSQLKANWPWDWNGTEAIVPSIEEDLAQPYNDPVYWLQVTGTRDLDLVYEVRQPDGTTDSIPRALRLQLAPVRLSGDDRNDRDLRFVQGSALDRLLSDKTLRSRLSRNLAETNVAEALSEESKTALSGLNSAFSGKSLPSDLDISITGAPGMSIMALIGLTAKRGAVELPLSSWGAGTRRLAALAISEQAQGTAPVAIVDEIERGLEPYRQRGLITQLQTGGIQSFVTTHSATAISAAAGSALWYVGHSGNIGKLEGAEVSRQRARDPEAFLARLTVVCEGITEVGFVTSLLSHALGADLRRFGIHVTDGAGHENTLGLLEALAQGGVHFAGFADDEGGKYSGRWERLDDEIGSLLFKWQSGCLEENIITLVSEADFERFIIDPNGTKTGYRLRSLQDRLGTQSKELDALRAKAGDKLRQTIIEAATGIVPEATELTREEQKHFRAHDQSWFKSYEGGVELFAKVRSLGLWPSLSEQLFPFVLATRAALRLEMIADIPP